MKAELSNQYRPDDSNAVADDEPLAPRLVPSSPTSQSSVVGDGVAALSIDPRTGRCAVKFF